MRNMKIKKIKENGCSPKHVSSHIYSVLSFLLKNDVMTLGMIVHPFPFVVGVFFFFLFQYTCYFPSTPHTHTFMS